VSNESNLEYNTIQYNTIQYEYGGKPAKCKRSDKTKHLNIYFQYFNLTLESIHKISSINVKSYQKHEHAAPKTILVSTSAKLEIITPKGSGGECTKCWTVTSVPPGEY
jgi:hypothetical protein